MKLSEILYKTAGMSESKQAQTILDMVLRGESLEIPLASVERREREAVEARSLAFAQPTVCVPWEMRQEIAYKFRRAYNVTKGGAK